MALDDLVDAYLSIPDYRLPHVSPQNDRLVVFENMSGRFGLSFVDLETGEVSHLHGEKVPRDPFGGSLEWAPDGDALYLVNDEFATLYEGSDTGTSVFRIALDGDVERLFTVEGQCDLWSVNPETGYLYYTNDEALHYFDPSNDSHGTFPEDPGPGTLAGEGASPTGEYVAYTKSRREEPENSDIIVAGPDGTDARKLDAGHEGQQTEPRAWHPDGRRLLVTENFFDYQSGSSRMGIYDLETGSMDWLANDRAIAFLDDGTGILSDNGPTVYDLEGNPTRIRIEGKLRFRWLDDVNVITDRGFVAERRSETRPGEIVHHDLGEDTTTTLVAADLGDVDPDEIVEPASVTYPLPDGSEAPATLYDSGVRPSPAVVIVYGLGCGPSKRFRPSIQLLVHLGYTVLTAGFPGDHFTDAEHAAFAAAGKWLKDSEWIDEDRVVVYGFSHGGYNAYMQAVRYPDVWSAVVASAGLTDLVALQEGADATGYQHPGVDDPEMTEDHLRAQSPIEYVTDESVPLLITHGTEDAHPIEQARRFVEALKRHGWSEGDDFQYVELEDRGHVSDWKIVTEFLEETL